MKSFWLMLSLALAGLLLGWQFGLQRNDVTIVPAASATLPDNHWSNLDGGQNQLSEWRDKVLIVNHWATWCEPCRKEIPMFMEVQQQYAEQGVELIGIAHDDEQDVRRYVDSMGMDYPQLLAGKGAGQKWLAELGNNGSLPFTLVFDREGSLRAKKVGLMSESELRRAVESVLSEAPTR
jgi:thiol-disulfide isomerase/thioredoxin